MALEKLGDALTQAMLDGLRKGVDEIFLYSQIDVPVDRGTLKKSGNIRPITNGFEVVYRTPYARPVEFGFKGHWQRVRRHRVRPHLRVLPRVGKNKISKVREHLRGPFDRYMPERKGAHFLSRSVDRVRPRFGSYVAGEVMRRLAGGRP